ncbi:dihydropyrimidinase [Lujinxingia litoralis]|uniref:Dihydropyrimidinase n=1 Tax=Lujinxingia litoralis TaxID=2211119 RepID=A0A328CDS9_9DELT|nr:dihydropyrimidinase [Lujinxingia litoralis]RAL25179.1 dihydropyrimidinase [Lujinxingia litoralis]
MSNLVIRNGEIVTASQRYVADIYCEHGRIKAIGQELQVPQGTEEYDARGKFVFPGFIDPHTHVRMEFMGTFAADDYESATIAALCGGTTTLIDFCIPNRDESPLSAFKTWQEASQGKACSDFTWHMAITRFDDEVERELREIVSRGVASFKVFLAYGGALGVDDEALLGVMKLARELGVVVTAHCENSEMIDTLQKKLVDEGKLGPEWHEPSRPTFVEAEGTRHFCAMARVTGAHGYIVHLSCEEALKEAVEAQLQGANIWIETLIQHLVLDHRDAERPNFEGAKFVMSPPLRDKRNQAPLWAGFDKGMIATLGSDHAPFNMAQKRMGEENFCLIPNGIPSLEDRVRVFFTEGVQKGRIDLHRFVDAASTQAARIFGLFPQKGTIQIGSDADLVVYDPTVKETLSVDTHHMNVDYNPFEGREVEGRCALVTVRGQIQVRDGEFVGEKGIGEFLKREPTHF